MTGKKSPKDMADIALRLCDGNVNLLSHMIELVVQSKGADKRYYDNVAKIRQGCDDLQAAYERCGEAFRAITHEHEGFVPGSRKTSDFITLLREEATRAARRMDYARSLRLVAKNG